MEIREPVLSAPAETPPEAPAGRVPEVSAREPDWTRETCRRGWDPARRLLGVLRRYQRLSARSGVLARAAARALVPLFRFWSIVCGADIPLNAKIGGGLLLPHPQGVVIHPDCEIGPNCLFFQQVTLGTGGPLPGVPRLGGHVDVGAGAKILGGVRIGDHARIGANAVVLEDVPAGATAVGVPARILAEKRGRA